MKIKLLFLGILWLACSAYSQAQTVYITRTGHKYHRQNCRYLRYSSYPISTSEAKERGYTACLVCSPAKEATQLTQEKTETPVTSDQSPQKTYSSSQCTAATKSGARCRRMTTNASGRCWQHE